VDSWEEKESGSRRVEESKIAFLLRLSDSQALRHISSGLGDRQYKKRVEVAPGDGCAPSVRHRQE
jgi:hypothetical protein